ncbi:MAG TPA: hypothetical protein VE913_10330 [Longimicrobium sp.]|nr:hypothetical protein [Longimicrobium sp.]
MARPSMGVPTADASPAEVVSRVMSALDEHDWAGVVSLVDPDDITRFAAEQIEDARDAEAVPTFYDKVLGERSSLQRADAERFLEREADQRGERRERIARMYGGRGTAAELAELSPQEILRFWLAASELTREVRRACEEAGVPSEAIGALVASLTPRSVRKILGSVAEGDDREHVVYRERFAAEASDEDGVIRLTTLRRTSAGWRMLVDPNLMGRSDQWVVVTPAESSET